MSTPTTRFHTCQKSHSVYALWIKRGVDVSGALLALLLLSPLLLLIALILFCLQGCNPFFVQQRIGRGCTPFRIIKFCTMTRACGEDGGLLPDEERTTPFGRFLRATSLDELPELINVLKGDMSFIGPRPWVPEQMHTFSTITQQRRMLVRPGMSGLAQIRGRNDLTFRQRVCFDLYYIRHLSCGLDVQILIYTLYKVVLREGIQQRPGALQKYSPRLTPKDPASKGLRGNAPGSKSAATA